MNNPCKFRRLFKVALAFCQMNNPFDQQTSAARRACKWYTAHKIVDFSRKRLLSCNAIPIPFFDLPPRLFYFWGKPNLLVNDAPENRPQMYGF